MIIFWLRAQMLFVTVFITVAAIGATDGNYFFAIGVFCMVVSAWFLGVSDSTAKRQEVNNE